MMRLGFNDTRGGTQLLLGAARIDGPGAVILTGPSSCGKGEIAKGLCDVLGLSRDRWLSMGDILRSCTNDLSMEGSLGKQLEEYYGLSRLEPLLQSRDASEDLERKMSTNSSALSRHVSANRLVAFTPNLWRVASALEWLSFCTINGLLVPNRWTQALVEVGLAKITGLKSEPILIDGYPRTEQAARHLLDVLRKHAVPVVSVLHLSISRQQMLSRAGGRGRLDDTPDALLKRYDFYIESVQPSVDYLKDALPPGTVSLIDAHQPSYDIIEGNRLLNLSKSIQNVLVSSLKAIGLPDEVSRALVYSRYCENSTII